MRVLVVDNYDSFAYNLVQAVGAVLEDPTGPDGEVIVRRNDAIDLAALDALGPDAIVVSPGPGTPADAGVSIPVFAEREYPTMGVCLGHQALCAANGAEVGHAPAVVHGKTSLVAHDGRGVFRDLPERLEVGRYHSLAVPAGELPDALTLTAWTDDESGIVMGVRHESRPHIGLQFHPESMLTGTGDQLVGNFLSRAT
ncbi:MAG: aminodeoxychorismate/anthranilate synthase component II [Salinirussus sp.]